MKLINRPLPFNRPLPLAAGVTLVELMVVVAIIGILSAVLIPYYADYAREGRRGDILLKLGDFAQTAERSFAIVGEYTQENLESMLPADSDHYRLAVVVTDNNFGFTATATAVGGQLKDEDCQVLTVDNLGVHTAESMGSEDTTALCWP